MQRMRRNIKYTGTKFDETLGITVSLREFESIDSLLKRFKRKVQKSEIIREVKEKMEYIKPSIARKMKSMNARRREEREKIKMEKQMEKKQKKIKKSKNNKKEIERIQTSNVTKGEFNVEN